MNIRIWIVIFILILSGCDNSRISSTKELTSKWVRVNEMKLYQYMINIAESKIKVANKLSNTSGKIKAVSEPSFSGGHYMVITFMGDVGEIQFLINIYVKAYKSFFRIFNSDYIERVDIDRLMFNGEIINEQFITIYPNKFFSSISG